MAVGTLYTGTEVKYGMAEGATYGTAIGDGDAFVELSNDSPIIFEPDVQHRTDLEGDQPRHQLLRNHPGILQRKVPAARRTGPPG